jgi:uroporphyrin-III C-methyltransferase
VEVVSGITAGMGATAEMGIPLTHREICNGVTFVTGHTRDGRQPDWRALAAGGTTLVIYMGVANLEAIARGLLEGGLPAATPAAAIQNGTLPSQKSVVTTLSTLADEMALAGIGSPAVIVIGDVVRFARSQHLPAALADVA